jgi:trans-aconitate 2-methyltransferase
MTEWNAGHYLKYGDERTRPAWDLAARIQLEAPQKIVDLGCGPGNSTQVLRSRWPDADITGIDSSSTMIENARRDWPDHNWLQADISGWTGNSPYDLVFSNAALQWIPNHHLLMPHLLSLVAQGGVLAFQIPSSVFAVVRTLIHEISCDPEWTDRMTGARSALTMEAPSF